MQRHLKSRHVCTLLATLVAGAAALAIVTDLNQDGFGDIVTTNHLSHSMTVLINRLKVSPP